MSVIIRSSDVFVGLPYDVMCYALTLDAIASSIGCVPGTLHITLAHAHLYQPHFDAARACTVQDWRSFEWENKKHFADVSSSWPKNCQPSLPGWSIESILSNPDMYIDVVKNLGRRVENPAWDPAPVVIE